MSDHDTAANKKSLALISKIDALSDDVTKNPSPLLQERHVYKPFLYPWCYEAWHTQQRVHWLPEEVPMAADINDWKNKLTPSEINLLTQIFRFFTQADVEVNNCYMRHYSRVFGPAVSIF